MIAAHTEATRPAERLVRDPHLFKSYAVAPHVSLAPLWWRRLGGLAAIDVAMALLFGVGLGWL